ncbi:MAG: hypothetical protein MJ033_07945 [Victivallaceae bacterium]|nr:hypothetical protein [Victivallaceae bacterium]
MKKISFLMIAMIAGIGSFADTVTLREPGLVEGVVVGTGGIVTGLVGMTKDLLVGRTVTYTTPNGVTAVPSCAVVTSTPIVYAQAAVIPSAPPVVVTPSGQPVVSVPQTVAVVPNQTTVVYLPYRGWGPPPLRPRHYYHPYPGQPIPAHWNPNPYPRPALR